MTFFVKKYHQIVHIIESLFHLCDHQKDRLETRGAAIMDENTAWSNNCINGKNINMFTDLE